MHPHISLLMALSYHHPLRYISGIIRSITIRTAILYHDLLILLLEVLNRRKKPETALIDIAAVHRSCFHRRPIAPLVVSFPLESYNWSIVQMLVFFQRLIDQIVLPLRNYILDFRIIHHQLEHIHLLNHQITALLLAVTDKLTRPLLHFPK